MCVQIDATPALGQLLPAIAAACERHSAVPPGHVGKSSDVSRTLSRSRVSYNDVSKAYQDDATLIKVCIVS